VSIVLFDGVCNLCNGFVAFVLPRDRSGRFSFAPLQSETGRRLLSERGIAPATEDGAVPGSIVLIEDGHAYVKSDAALRIARRLSGAWPLLFAFALVPRFVRDRVYDWVARNRYRWFGKREQCLLPRPEYAKRLLDR
jgi:predicted DCC family thiol-disulfide oxidoreductase YuxK